MRTHSKCLCAYLAIFVAMFSCLSQPCSLGQGMVLRGVAEKPLLERVEAIRKDPKVKDAFFSVSTSEEVKAVCSLSQLETLKLTFQRKDGRFGFTDDAHLKRQSDDAEGELASGLAKLSNLKKLDLALLDAKGSPDQILDQLTKLPLLSDLHLHWSLPLSFSDRQNRTKVMIPPLPSVKHLEVFGYLTNYQFEKNFPFDSLLSFKCNNCSLSDQSALSNMRNLKVLEWFGDEPISSRVDLTPLSRIEQFRSGKPVKLPLEKWTSLKELSLENIGNEDIDAIGKLGQLTNLSLTCKEAEGLTLEPLGRLSELNSLTLRLNPSKPAPGVLLVPLSKCSKLTSLEVNGFSLDTDALSSISKITSLKNLLAWGTQSILGPESTALLNPLYQLESVALPLGPKKARAQALQAVTGWKMLKSLHLENSDLRDSDISFLIQFPGLEEIHLENNNLTDESIKILSRLKHLKTIKISSNEIKGTNLGLLSKLPQLEELDLTKNRISDAELLENPIASERLTSLFLSGNQIRGKGLQALSSLTNLKKLALNNMPLNDEAASNIKNKSLEQISLSGTEVTEHAVEQLSLLPKLTTVVAYGTGIKQDWKPPSKLGLAFQVGWYEYDYDDLLRREEEHKLNEELVRIRLGKGKLEELSNQPKAECLKALGEYEQAVATYDKAIYDLQHPKYYVCSMMSTGQNHRIFECYDGRGMAYAGMQTYDKALEDLNKAVGMAKASAYARTHRGYILTKLGRLDEALADLNRAIEINPKIPAAYEYRSWVYDAMKKPELAAIDKRQSKELGYKPEVGFTMRDIDAKHMIIRSK